MGENYHFYHAMKNQLASFRRFLFVWPVLLFCLPVNMEAQSPYELSPTLDVSLTLGGAGLGAWGFLREKNMDPLTVAELAALDPSQVNPFDRMATDFFSDRVDFASDLTLIAGAMAPFALLAGDQPRQEMKTVGLMLLEGYLWTEAFTSISKSVFQRIRPYAYNPAAPASLKVKSDARASLISGHSSFTAFGSFFAAQLFQDYYPESKWKPAVWVGAATLSGATAYLRVRAGRHFPTDVLAGYAVGAAVGVLMPRLHHKKEGSYLTVAPTLNGIGLTYKF